MNFAKTPLIASSDVELGLRALLGNSPITRR